MVCPMAITSDPYHEFAPLGDYCKKESYLLLILIVYLFESRITFRPSLNGKQLLQSIRK